jgi:hypothetical protein
MFVMHKNVYACGIEMTISTNIFLLRITVLPPRLPKKTFGLVYKGYYRHNELLTLPSIFIRTLLLELIIESKPLAIILLDCRLVDMLAVEIELRDGYKHLVRW